MTPIAKQIIDLFPDVIKRLDNGSDELAYLSLTSKPEAIIRDQFAILLEEKERENKTYIREYKRFDLAKLDITDPRNPNLEHVIEFKAGSATSFFRGKPDEDCYYKAADNFVNRVIEDFRKSKELLNIMTGVFIGVEGYSEDMSSLGKHIKYAHRYKSYYRNIKEYGTKKDVAARMVERFKKEEGPNSPFSLIKHRSEKAGNYYGIDVIIHFVVVEPNIDFQF